MQLSRDQLAALNDQGFLVLEDLLPAAILDAICGEIEQTIDRHAREALARGEIDDLCADLGFYQRLISLNAQSGRLYDRISVGRLNGPALFALFVEARLLNIAEQLVGPEVLCSPTYRVRPKMPYFPRTDVLWHQDVAYMPAEFDTVYFATFWIPLLDVSEQNGCLHVVPQGHRNGVFRHVQETYYLDIDDPKCPLERAQPVPMRRGSALLLHPWMPHCSLPHTEAIIRWSIDVRYQDARLPCGNTGEAGFLARSIARPDDVVTEADAFRRIREDHSPLPIAPRWERRA